jgi:Kef-type K+ transport system membrane component KefB
MEHHSVFFLNLILVLLGARVLGEGAARLGIPAMIGEMGAGVLLGPSLLGWVEPGAVLKIMAEFGLILLLFEVGLETDTNRLLTAGTKAGIVAVGGFVAPLVLGGALAYWGLDLPLLVSLFIGGTLTATSIGVTVRVLRDLKQQRSHAANIVLGAAVFDDVLGVVLLALLFEFATSGTFSLTHAGQVFVFIAFFLVLAPIAAKLTAVVVRRLNTGSLIPGMIPTVIVSLVLTFALLAQLLGAPELIGGFAAGLALSRRFFLPFGVALHESDSHFVERIDHEMKPIIQLFTPVFFVMVGLSLHLQEIDWGSPSIWSMSAAFIGIAMVSKLAGAMLIKEPWTTRWAIGIAMIPRAEVGLIFAELGKTAGVFSQQIYAVMLLTIAVTTVAPPFMLRAYYRRLGAADAPP